MCWVLFPFSSLNILIYVIASLCRTIPLNLLKSVKTMATVTLPTILSIPIKFWVGKGLMIKVFSIHIHNHYKMLHVDMIAPEMGGTIQVPFSTHIFYLQHKLSSWKVSVSRRLHLDRMEVIIALLPHCQCFHGFPMPADKCVLSHKAQCMWRGKKLHESEYVDSHSCWMYVIYNYILKWHNVTQNWFLDLKSSHNPYKITMLIKADISCINGEKIWI